MTILATGGAGYIGSHTVHALVDAGYDVLVVDNLSTGVCSAVPKSARLIVGDAGDRELIEPLLSRHGVDSIIHFAGSIVVSESVAKPLNYYLNNTVASRALIAAAYKCGVKNLVFSSTAAVYGNQGDQPIHEEAPKQPLSPYGWSKLMTEIMLGDACKAHRLNHVILRYFNVAGADPGLRTGQSGAAPTHLIKLAAQTAVGLRPALEVYGRDYDA